MDHDPIAPSRLLSFLLGSLALLAAGCTGAGDEWQAQASTLALTIRAGDSEVTAGTGSVTAQAGRLADGCPRQAPACASAGTVSPPFGESVQAWAGGREGPVTAAHGGRLPPAISRLASLDAAPSTAQAARGTASVETGDLALDLTPARGFVDGLPLRGTLDTLLRRSASGPGPLGRLETLADLLDAAGTASIATLQVGPSQARATTADGAPHATAAGGSVDLVLGPDLPGVTDGLVVLTVQPGRAGAGVRGGIPAAEVESPRVTLRWLDLVTGEYTERELHPGEASCAGPNPLRACVEQDPTSHSATATAAQTTVGATRVRLFAAPLPELAVEVGPVRAAVELTPEPATGSGEGLLYLAALAALAVAVFLAGREAAPPDRPGSPAGHDE